VRTQPSQEKIRCALWKWKKPITEIGNIGVRVGSIHSAKGLESKNVFVSDEINHTIDSAMWDDKEKYKDEARVFFMACTRAKDRLFIVHSVGKKLKFDLPRHGGM